MKGTPALGKAKTIKEKRELAAELGESHLWDSLLISDDVREFAAKRGANGRGRSAKSRDGSQSAEVQSRSATPEAKEEVSDGAHAMLITPRRRSTL